MGNTQGVSSARNPPSIPPINIPMKDISARELIFSPHPGSNAASLSAREFFVVELFSFTCLSDVFAGVSDADVYCLITAGDIPKYFPFGFPLTLIENSIGDGKMYC